MSSNESAPYEINDSMKNLGDRIRQILPPIRDSDVILYRTDEDGKERMVIRCLVKYSTTRWEVEEFNPHSEGSLDRSIWTKCHRIIGKLSRR